MKAQEDKIKGNFNSSVGKAKQVVGKALKDKDLERRGVIQKEKGKGQKMSGAIKETIQKSSHALGDVVKEAGKKINRARVF